MVIFDGAYVYQQIVKGRAWRDIWNSFIYLDLSVQITHDSLVIFKFPHTFSHINFILSLD